MPIWKRKKRDESIRVVVCDDQREVRAALRRHFEKDGRIEIVAEADDGLRVTDVVLAARPDAVTLDLAMPHLDGLSSIKRILAVSPKTRIVVLSAMVPFGNASVEAERQGAHAVFSKNVRPNQLIETIVDLVRRETG